MAFDSMQERVGEHLFLARMQVQAIANVLRERENKTEEDRAELKRVVALLRKIDGAVELHSYWHSPDEPLQEKLPF